jgi:hypothetical protein
MEADDSEPHKSGRPTTTVCREKSFTTASEWHGVNPTRKAAAYYRLLVSAPGSRKSGETWGTR